MKIHEPDDPLFKDKDTDFVSDGDDAPQISVVDLKGSGQDQQRVGRKSRSRCGRTRNYSQSIQGSVFYDPPRSHINAQLCTDVIDSSLRVVRRINVGYHTI